MGAGNPAVKFVTSIERIMTSVVVVMARLSVKEWVQTFGKVKWKRRPLRTKLLRPLLRLQPPLLPLQQLPPRPQPPLPQRRSPWRRNPGVFCFPSPKISHLYSIFIHLTQLHLESFPFVFASQFWVLFHSHSLPPYPPHWPYRHTGTSIVDR